MNRLNKTESAAFLYCRFSLLMKDPFSRLFKKNVWYARLQRESSDSKVEIILTFFFSKFIAF